MLFSTAATRRRNRPWRIIEQFEADVAGLDNLRIATVSGRYYAMDRDKRWDRVDEAYRTIVDGEGATAAETRPRRSRRAYDRGETDEFVRPTAIGDYRGMRDGDGLLIANFRADRVREIATALLDPDFSGFAPSRRVKFAAALGLVEYSTELNRFLGTLFPPENLDDTFGEVISQGRVETAAHRRDREICACHVFL